jgi:hypothetical protein
MFPDLIEKLRRRVDLTEDEASSAMAASALTKSSDSHGR